MTDLLYCSDTPCRVEIVVWKNNWNRKSYRIIYVTMNRRNRDKKPIYLNLFGFIIIITLLVGMSGDGYGNNDFLSDLKDMYRQQDYQALLIKIENHPEQIPLYPNQIALLRLLALIKLNKTETAWQFLMNQEKNYKITLQEHLWSIYLDSLLEKQQFAEAEKAYDHLRTISKLPHLLHVKSLQLGDLSLANNMFPAAVSFFIEALNHAYDESERLEALMGISRVLAKRGNFLEALLFTKKLYYSFKQLTSRQARILIESYITQLNPDLFPLQIRFDIANFLLQLGEVNATVRFLDSIDLNTLDFTLLHDYGVLWIRIFLRREDLKSAQHVLEQTNWLIDNPDRSFYQGVVYQRLGQYSFAVNAYEDGLTRFPKNEYTLNTIRNLAFCYRMMGDENRYLTSLDRMRTWYPMNSEPSWEKFWYLYRKGNLQEANKALEILFRYPEEKNRSRFWKYKIDRSPQNIHYLEEIIQSSTLDYYFVRAWQELAQSGKSLPSANELFPAREYIPNIHLEKDSEKYHWSHYLLLNDFSLKENAKAELLTLYRLKPSRVEFLYELSRFYARNGEYRKSQIYAIYFQNHFPEANQYKNVWKKIYPEYYLPTIKEFSNQHQIDPYLVLSLIKAESTFESDLVSTAGAVGLMQLMPSTASWMIETGMSSAFAFSSWSPSFLTHPKINIELGITYFAYLVEQFEQKICPAIAAYNAGPGRLKNWLKPNSVDPDVFIEDIPYLETRNYLKKVMTNYFYYSMIYLGRFNLSPCTF